MMSSSPFAEQVAKKKTKIFNILLTPLENYPVLAGGDGGICHAYAAGKPVF